MKNLAAKLKGMNYKQALVDHGEKLILGLIGSFVLICLAGTSWSRYDKQPEEFTKKVEQGETAIKNSAWTVEKQAEFKSSRDIMQAVNVLHSPLDASRYVYSTNWFWPMYPTGLKVGEPKWLAPIQPIATDGKFVMIENPIVPSQGTIAGVFDNAPGTKPKDEVLDEFAPRRAANDPIGGAVAGPTAGANDLTVPLAAGPTDSSYNTMISGITGTDMSGAGGPPINAVGTRFSAIRAVFPLSDQLDEFVKAMHETKQKAAELVDFIDFEVERQVAQPGDKPWSDKWEKVDFQATLELLERVDYDTEVVDLAYTDAVFTMPLPRRVTGSWKGYASHPLIKAMTDEQVELQAQLMKRMVEEAEKQKKDDPRQKKGLFNSQVDARSMRSQFSGNEVASMMTDMQAEMRKGSAMPFSTQYNSSTMVNMADPSMMGGFQDQMTRNNGRMSKYLLLRYFDFQVNPGNAYRYRMRLTLRNPNFGRPVEELVQEETALDEVRVTPWSEPTAPVYFPNDERIFLARVDKARTETGLPSAYLDVYQWFSEAGTTIAAKLEKLQLGQFVGGRPPKTEVFRLAEYTLKEEEIPVFTGSVLADISASAAVDLDFAENSDLKLDARKMKQLGVVDKALLVDRFGQLVTLDPKRSTEELAQAEQVVDRERRGIRAALKARPEVPQDGNTLYGMPGDDPMGTQMQMQRGQASPLKKGGPKGSKKATSKKPGVYEVPAN